MLPMSASERQLLDELKDLVALDEQERQLMAFEIHDGFVQMLTGAAMHLETAIAHEPALPHECRQQVQTALTLVRDSIAEARRLISGLSPPVLAAEGLVPAIEQLVRSQESLAGPAIEFVHENGLARLPAAVEKSAFRIVQEALTNAQRHSGSARVEVRLSRTADRLRLAVQDWGRGFDPSQVPQQRFGLRSIRERARLLGGQAKIVSALGQGTLIQVELPLRAADLEQAAPRPAE